MSPRRPVLAVLAVLVALAACSSDPAAVPEQPPLITITGVAGGQVYAAPVTITDAVDRGAYAARLNGQLFVSGTSVETPGDSLDDASAGSSALNDGSLGVRLKRGSFEVFLAGDGEVRANGASGASAWLARAAPAWRW